MATVLFGTDASISTSGFGGLYNAFTVTVTQGITQAAGFGDAWMRTRGTILSATMSISGFITKGGANDRPGLSNTNPMTGLFLRAGATVTAQFITGCTLAFTGICTGFGADVQYLGNQTLSYGFASDGAVTETWVVS